MVFEFVGEVLVMKDLKVSDVTKRFLEWVADRRKPATHRYYSGRLAFLDRQLGSRKCRKLKKETLEDWLRNVNHWPDGRLKAPDTVRANVTALEQWQKFAVKQEILKKPLLDDIEKPAGRTRDRLPTLEEVEIIKRHSSLEFNLIYEALRRCGARPNELARATTDHWDRVTRQIVLADHKTAEKTGQPRTIAVGEKLETIIRSSMGDREAGHLFLTPMGHVWTVGNLSSTFRRARNKADLDRRLVLYLARHEHGTAVYHAEGELAAATALGHKGTGMIARYAKIPPAMRRATQDALAI